MFGLQKGHAIYTWQMLSAPNTFEPAPNIISKTPKISFISKMKIRN